MTTLVPFVRVSDSSPAPSPACDAVVVIGNFDGVHRGHQAVLSEAVRDAGAHGQGAVVLTFDPHPAAVVSGGAPPLLTTLERRAELVLRLGVERIYARHFDAAFAAWSPDRFVRELVHGALRAKVVSVGENFRFGAKRAGDMSMLRALGSELGFEVRVHALARDAVGTFSSTRARMCIAAGDLDGATEVLGRPHALSGVVGHGAKRGRTIGFPTANLESVPEMLPPDGVYAVVIDRLEGTSGRSARALARGVMNVGVRPTLAGVAGSGEPARTIEAHLFDFDGDLYEAMLRVHLVARLRDERKLAGLDALKEQIARDVVAARIAVAGVPVQGAAFG